MLIAHHAAGTNPSRESSNKTTPPVIQRRRLNPCNSFLLLGSKGAFSSVSSESASKSKLWYEDCALSKITLQSKLYKVIKLQQAFIGPANKIRSVRTLRFQGYRSRSFELQSDRSRSSPWMFGSSEMRLRLEISKLQKRTTPQTSGTLWSHFA